jgi:hypothetical protein
MFSYSKGIIIESGLRGARQSHKKRRTQAPDPGGISERAAGAATAADGRGVGTGCWQGDAGACRCLEHLEVDHC